MTRKAAFAVMACVAIARSVAAAEVDCGATLSLPGSYTLRASCVCTGNGPCITVSANDVTLDLDNKVIACRPANPPATVNETTFGVYASSISNFTLMGAAPSVARAKGGITGCYVGLQAGYDQNVFVDRVDFSGNTYIGVNTGFSTDVLLTRNTVNGIGGFIGADGHNGYAIAFNGCGTRCTVSSNVIRNVTTQARAVKPVSGEGVGIIVSDSSKSVVIAYNWLENADESAEASGIRLNDDSVATVESNSITGFWAGISGTGSVTATDNRIVMRKPSRIEKSFGIYSAVNTNGCASGNVIVNYATPFGTRIRTCGRNQTYY